MLTLARARAEEGAALGRLLAQIDTMLAMAPRSPHACSSEEWLRLRAYHAAYSDASALLEAVIKREDNSSAD